MDEEKEVQQQSQQQGSKVSEAVDTARDVKSKVDKAKKAKDAAKAAKTGAKAAKAGSAAAAGPLAVFMFYAIIIIIIIIVVIGIVMFLITMPGMVMEKLKALARELASGFCSWFGTDDVEGSVKEQDIYDVLDYLEDMGYDLQGYGFLNSSYTDDTDISSIEFDSDVLQKNDVDKDNIEKDVKIDNGVIRSKKSGKIVKANSDFINTYLISDTYIYIVKNYNLNTESKNGYEWWSAFKAIAGHFLNLFGNAGNEMWGKGMIEIYHEGSGLGTTGEFYGRGIFHWSDIDVDPGKKTMTIRRGWGANKMSYNLDGWTGRYGMPLEFLLSLHIATQMPDLASDVATSFNTHLLMILKDISGGNVTAYYKTEEGKLISYPEVESATRSFKRNDASLISIIISGIEELFFTTEEAQAMLDLGFNHKPDCGCIEEEEKDKDGNPVLDEDGNPVIVTTICDECKDYFKAILSVLSENNNNNFKTYMPYIASVTDHWFRNVYFVVTDTSLALTQNDEEYEAVMKERWTKYEQNDDGTYKLYEIDEKGEYKKDGGNYVIFNGTQKEADEKGIKVAKKAETTTADKIKGWNKEDGVYTAYKVGGTASESPVRVYTDEQIEEDNDATDQEKEIMRNVYYTMKISKNIIQVEEGQRGVTNSKIKQIFLNNKYFKYDGSPETAEIIEKARKQLQNKYSDYTYGSLNNRIKELNEETGEAESYKQDIDYENETVTIDYENEVDGTIKKETKKFKVKDYVGTLALNQNSLGAFSMLENTHTADADYIYKDFKELIVELGYFRKEELTETTPKVFAWFIPQIGSGGYPLRVLDKKETEYGTFAHSKDDYIANTKNTLRALLDKVGSELPEEQNAAEEAIVHNATQRMNEQRVRGFSLSENGIDNTKVGAVTVPGAERTISSVSLDEFLKTTREMCEYMNREGYDYCVYATDAGDGEQFCHHAPVHGNSCHLSTTFADSQTSVSVHNVCCATLVSWALQNVGVMPDSDHLNGANALATYCLDVLGGTQISPSEALQPGDILCYEGHIDLVGEQIDSGFVKYNGGGYVKIGATEGGDHSCIQHISGWPSNALFAVRLPWGNSTSAPYVGYEGGEAVVSPATGILLDYGTYDDTVDPLTQTEDRVNVDFRPFEEEGDTEEAATETTEEENSQKIVDKVGYAKILVLDQESYQKLENYERSKAATAMSGAQDKAGTGVKTYLNTDGSFLENPSLKEEKALETWSDDDKTLYGYKEFGELYEKFGLSGYILYLDGFKCELPKEEGEFGNEEEQGNGTMLSMEYFKSQASSYEETLYEPAEKYRLSSIEATNKLNNEEQTKEEAAPFVYLASDDLLFIKEGTVLGRTISDKELLEEPEYRNKEYGTYKEVREDCEEGKEQVLGNYLRIIMRDLDDTIVEDVDQYLKIDENMNVDNDWELFYWLPFESGGTDLPGQGPECQGTCSEGETAVGIIQWTVLVSSNMNNIAGQFIPGCMEANASLCAPLQAYASWTDEDFWNDYIGAKQFQKTLTQICNSNRDAFLNAQMEVAKKQYLEPILEKYPWLASRPSCVQGEIMHLKVWGADYSWVSGYESKSDEDIILKVRNTIANTGSTAGPASGDETSGRAYNEPQIALEILSGRASAEKVEQWVRNRDASVFSFDFK